MDTKFPIKYIDKTYDEYVVELTQNEWKKINTFGQQNCGIFISEKNKNQIIKCDKRIGVSKQNNFQKVLFLQEIYPDYQVFPKISYDDIVVIKERGMHENADKYVWFFIKMQKLDGDLTKLMYELLPFELSTNPKYSVNSKDLYDYFKAHINKNYNPDDAPHNFTQFLSDYTIVFKKILELIKFHILFINLLLFSKNLRYSDKKFDNFGYKFTKPEENTFKPKNKYLDNLQINLDELPENSIFRTHYLDICILDFGDKFDYEEVKPVLALLYCIKLLFSNEILEYGKYGRYDGLSKLFTNYSMELSTDVEIKNASDLHSLLRKIEQILLSFNENFVLTINKEDDEYDYYSELTKKKYPIKYLDSLVIYINRFISTDELKLDKFNLFNKLKIQAGGKLLKKHIVKSKKSKKSKINGSKNSRKNNTYKYSKKHLKI